MSSGLYSHTTRSTGTVLTAAIYNADHINHITNQNPEMTGGYSDSVGQMQLTTDPGRSGSESLALSMAGELERLRYAIGVLGGGAEWYDLPSSPPLPPGFFSISVASAADAAHDVTFFPGRARSDDDTDNVDLASAITKRIDAAWAVGDNEGGLDTGTVGSNNIYYLWIIRRSDTGVVDALFSLSATAPTMPANYDVKQRVGWVLTDGSSNIRGFSQSVVNIHQIRFNTPIEDVDTTQGTTSTTRTLSLPPNSAALVRVQAFRDDDDFSFVVRPLTEGDATPSPLASPGTSLSAVAFSDDACSDAGEFVVELNGSSQLATRADAIVELQIVTLGAILPGIMP